MKPSLEMDREWFSFQFKKNNENNQNAETNVKILEFSHTQHVGV